MRLARTWLLCSLALAACGRDALPGAGDGSVTDGQGGAGADGGGAGGMGGGGMGGGGAGGMGGGPACGPGDGFDWGMDGGDGPTQRRSFFMPPRLWRQQLNYADGRPPVDCKVEVPGCDAMAAVNLDILRMTYLQPDVQAALKEPMPPLFGRDLRPVDGQVFTFHRPDGRGFGVGAPCTGAMPCRDVPPGLAAFVEILERLDAQQLKDPSCAKVRP